MKTWCETCNARLPELANYNGKWICIDCFIKQQLKDNPPIGPDRAERIRRLSWAFEDLQQKDSYDGGAH